MPKYLVTYDVEMEIEADNEDEAIELGIEQWNDMPDGSWEAVEID